MKFYLPIKNDVLGEYTITYMERNILDWINERSLQLGGKSAKTYYDRLKFKVHFEPEWENGRIDKKDVILTRNHRHDFWKGEQYDIEERTKYTVYYNECDFIQTLVHCLETRKDIMSQFMENWIFFYLRERKFINTSLDTYFSNHYDEILSFENLVPYIETEYRDDIIKFISMFQMEKNREITIKEIKVSIHKQIQDIAEIERQFVSFPLYTEGYENEFVEYANKTFAETYKISECNQKVFQLIK